MLRRMAILCRHGAFQLLFVIAMVVVTHAIEAYVLNPVIYSGKRSSTISPPFLRSFREVSKMRFVNPLQRKESDLRAGCIRYVDWIVV